jgi:predicted oxidoreductase
MKDCHVNAAQVYGRKRPASASEQIRRTGTEGLKRGTAPHFFVRPGVGTRPKHHCDLDGRVFGLDGDIVPGLYAVGEATGFGGGGMHGHGSLEGTFLGGCLFSGLQAGRATAKVL